MRDHMGNHSVDLIYLDPPFNSNREYNNIYKDETGRLLPDQIKAFNDMWELTPERQRVIEQMPVLVRETGVDDGVVEFWRYWMNALRHTQPDLLAYLLYMVERLMYMKLVLKPTGTIYLHCDPKASHYIKVMMDSIFGHAFYHNEIVWERIKGAGKMSQHGTKNYGRNSDRLLYYSKSPTYHFDAEEAVTPYTHTDLVNNFPHTDDKGRFKRRSPFRPPGLGPRPNLCYEYKGISPPYDSGWTVQKSRLEELDDLDELEWVDGKVYRKQRPRKGISLTNIWTDINPAVGNERLGYATQKPVALLERIIQISSKPADVIFDPFCGCGTSLEAAQRLGRKWIGIDIAIHAIKRVAKIRLQDRCKLVEGQDFTVQGVPETTEGAHDLWERDKYHFQQWAVEQVDGFVTSKRTADGGVDGRLYFEHPDEVGLQSMAIVRSKAGNTSL